ncbi:MAG: carboxypeptidase-like regulatory domain-containing protein, partial [Bacteroidales bacterium]
MRDLNHYLKVLLLLTIPWLSASIFQMFAVDATGISEVTQSSRRITGMVKDQKGEPLIGVNVVIKGTTTGTMTNIEGSYVLEKVENGSTIEFSYIGYLSKSIRVGDNNVVNVVLTEDT